MSRRYQGTEASDNLGDRLTSLSDRLLNALTPQELAQLMDALFTVLSPQLQEEAIAQLSEDTQQTVRQILASDSAVELDPGFDTQTTSLAKQAQIWSELWRSWERIEKVPSGSKHWGISIPTGIGSICISSSNIHPIAIWTICERQSRNSGRTD